LIMFLLFCGVAIIAMLLVDTTNAESITSKALIEDINNGRVDAIEVESTNLKITYDDNAQREFRINENVDNVPQMLTEFGAEPAQLQAIEFVYKTSSNFSGIFNIILA